MVQWTFYVLIKVVIVLLLMTIMLLLLMNGNNAGMNVMSLKEGDSSTSSVKGDDQEYSATMNTN